MIFTAWLSTLVFGLTDAVLSWHPILVAGFVVIRTFLYTGMFVVAHDSMHNSLLAGKPEVNRWVGRTMLLLYAGLDFDLCLHNHRLHHQFPESKEDPDFFHSSNPNMFRWYANFIGNYIHFSQMTGLVIGWLFIYGFARMIDKIPFGNILILSVIPLILSSLQLFVVGTWFPHRQVNSVSSCATPRSLSLAPLFSLAACYHFGYHREHHESPSTPWFELPKLNLTNKAA